MNKRVMWVAIVTSLLVGLMVSCSARRALAPVRVEKTAIEDEPGVYDIEITVVNPTNRTL